MHLRKFEVEVEKRATHYIWGRNECEVEKAMRAADDKLLFGGVDAEFYVREVPDHPARDIDQAVNLNGEWIHVTDLEDEEGNPTEPTDEPDPNAPLDQAALECAGQLRLFPRGKGGMAGLS